MSVVALIIKLIKRKKKMNEELEIGTFTPNTHPVLTALNERVEVLTKANEDLLDEVTMAKNNAEFVSAQLKKWSDKYRLVERSVQDTLKQMLDDEEIEFEAAEKIAELFDDVNLLKQATIRYTITADVLVEMPYNADVDAVANDVYLDRVDFSTYSEGEVLETDPSIEDWSIIS